MNQLVEGCDRIRDELWIICAIVVVPVSFLVVRFQEAFHVHGFVFAFAAMMNGHMTAFVVAYEDWNAFSVQAQVAEDAVTVYINCFPFR